MDNRPDPVEDEQATPEHESGHVGRAGYDRAQPDRSGTESEADSKRATDTATTEVSGTGRPDTADKQYASDDLAELLAPVTDAVKTAAWNVLRRYPAHVAIGILGLFILGSALAKGLAGRSEVRRGKLSATGMG